MGMNPTPWQSNGAESLLDEELSIGGIYSMKFMTSSYDGSLLSPGGIFAHRWIAGVNTAECKVYGDLKDIFDDYDSLDTHNRTLKEIIRDYSMNHGVPNQKCSCGFYSMKHFSRSFSYSYYSGYGTHMIILRLSGKIIEGKLGYRSQHAEPVGLIMARNGCQTLDEEKICEKYKLQFIPYWKSKYSNALDMMVY